MSLYNMLFGVNPNTDAVLSALGLTRDDIPRFRDCGVQDGKVFIYTRTGGGNRAFYESEQSCRDHYPEYFDRESEAPSGPWNSDLRELKGFLYDEDDDFDSTYATFYFSVDGVAP